jgi:starch-binding outer membrane protein, SusD/RagB family
MKSLYKLYLFILSSILLILSGCEDFLTEDPKSVIVPEYFGTPSGFQAGVTAAYSTMRSFYGTEGFMCLVVSGTDEFSHGAGSGSEFSDINKYAAGLNPSNSQLLTIWDNAYIAINTINGIIQIAPEVALDTAVKKRLIGESKYLRAHCYYLLVLTFGDVTLTTEFSSTPSSEAVRNPTSEIYDQIINDLLEAFDAVPAVPTETGRIAKPAVMHMLAKAYIAKASDVNAAEADDYEQAAYWATTLIRDQAIYGKSLLPDFASVHVPYSENNVEALYVIQRNNDLSYNEEGANQGLKENRSNFFFVPYYELTTTQGKKTMVRDAANGRPWRRYEPTRWLLDTAFVDRVNDTRYNKTFQTVWYCNQSNPNERIPGMSVGDTAIWMPGYNMDTNTIRSKNYLVITPDSNYLKTWPNSTKYDWNAGYSNKNYYPHMKKYIDPQLTNLYGAGGRRPFLVHRLAETYLLAAEALIHMGDVDSAAVLVNVIRQRAANNGGNFAAIEVDASDMTIDFILDEKSRELCGECMRWFDLKVEGKLQERVVAHNKDARPNFDPAKHLLRPIPQNQINRCTNVYKQNPGY